MVQALLLTRLAGGAASHLKPTPSQAPGRSSSFSRPSQLRKTQSRRQRPDAGGASVATVPARRPAGRRGSGQQLQAAEEAIKQAISGAKGRGASGMSPDSLAAIEAAVAALEADGGVPSPTRSPLLEGRWRLLYTSRPGTASPIQRTFTGVDSFSVFQDILLSDPSAPARVNNVVEFGGAGELVVEAEASTDARPIPGFVPRQGKGLPFGLLGTSVTTPPARPDLRVDFQFDSAAFAFAALPFKLPYPVPFRLLGDERKGWIDVTYMSADGSFRLSRGNKGTLFVLAKEVSPKERLLEAVLRRGEERDDEAVAALAEACEEAGGGVTAPARSPLAAGTWRLRWTRQGARANQFQRRLASVVQNFQVITPEGRLENVVLFAPWLRIRACAECEQESSTRTGVDITDVFLELGPLRFPLGIKADGHGFVDWLYLDHDFRITRGNKGSVFIHTREQE